MGHSQQLFEEIKQDLDDLLNDTATIAPLYEVVAEEGDKDAVPWSAIWGTLDRMRQVQLKTAGIVGRLMEVTKLTEIEDKLGR